MKILAVIDMQNDFIDGSLGTKEAELIVDKVRDKIKSFDGKVIFTRDTHPENYMQTQEGKNLPVPHCIKDTRGWEISEKLDLPANAEIIDKPTFGSEKFGKRLLELDSKESIESITLIGLCTDICVISNAFIAKAFLPEVPIIVDSACCAGVSVESHNRALDAMKVCQIQII